MIILAGKGETSCHIFTIVNPGDTHCHDSVGYVAIGSGAPHAVYSLIDAGYKKSMDKDSVKDIVIKAKERSEVAPGVGRGIKVEIV